jgi:hypothetical protein
MTTALLLFAFVLAGIVGMTGIALCVAAKRSDALEERVMLRRRLVAIARQRNDYYND